MRIINVQKVHSDFVSRHAKARTYLYRLGLLENGAETYRDYMQMQAVEQALNKSKINYKELGINYPRNFFASAFERELVTEIQ